MFEGKLTILLWWQYNWWTEGSKCVKSIIPPFLYYYMQLQLLVRLTGYNLQEVCLQLAELFSGFFTNKTVSHDKTDTKLHDHVGLKSHVIQENCTMINIK